VPLLLDVRALRVSYGPSVALAGVDLAVPEGCVAGILGPNGAGKSTLLSTIAGLVPPSGGTISHRGVRIDGRTAHDVARRGICLIPEGRGILPGLSVEDNLKVAVRNDPEVLLRTFERFPVLEQRLDQIAGTLSGGEQQMLSFARSLSDDAELLLVDEPSLGLAPLLVDMIESTLRHLHDERGRTIVWVEQYASRVLALADIVYILGRGRVVWAGEPAELESSPILTSSYLGGGVR
jgi:branched-chain amino acid transport system ATP-binding protein